MNPASKAHRAFLGVLFTCVKSFSQRQAFSLIINKIPYWTKVRTKVMKMDNVSNFRLATAAARRSEPETLSSLVRDEQVWEGVSDTPVLNRSFLFKII